MEVVAMLLRYGLVAVGSGLVMKGYSQEQASALTMDVEKLVGAAITFGTVAWGMWTRYGTKQVLVEEVKKKRLPTVSPVTGATTTEPLNKD